MKVALFSHSLLSCWNHGNAHFLRGVVADLRARRHQVRAFEARSAWSVQNLLLERGDLPLDELDAAYPLLGIRGGGVERYGADGPDLDAALDDVDVVLVHEWNPPELVAALGRRRARGGRFALLFHDTHHRTVTDPDAMARYDLDAYDGVLAFGEAVRERYVERGWGRQVFTWHEAADVRWFHPRRAECDRDLVWIGNWGDDERTEELRAFLLDPVRDLEASATVYGVRYPAHARRALRRRGIGYAGWLPNHRVPEVYARYRATVHVPRRPYASALPGIPTIRVFEALACGVPLVTAPWDDCDGLFTPGSDYLVARDGAHMRELLRALLEDQGLRHAIARHGRQTVLERHTCTHRVDELLAIVATLQGRQAAREAV